MRVPRGALMLDRVVTRGASAAAAAGLILSATAS